MEKTRPRIGWRTTETYRGAEEVWILSLRRTCMLTGPRAGQSKVYCGGFQVSCGPLTCETWPKLSWRHHNPQLQTLLQSYSNQNSMVLAQKQMHGSMEQNQEMIKDLNKTVELLEEKAFWQYSLDLPPKGKRNRSKNVKLRPKLKDFHTAKEITDKTKR